MAETKLEKAGVVEMSSPIISEAGESEHRRDPAQNSEYQHHPHHTAFVEKDRVDSVVLEKSTDLDARRLGYGLSDGKDSSISDSKVLGDGVDGGDGRVTRPWHRRLRKHSRPAIHAAIWLLFTG
jgi:hypothetical protein